MKEGLYEVGDMCRAVVSGRVVEILVIPPSQITAFAYVRYVDYSTTLTISQKNLTPL